MKERLNEVRREKTMSYSTMMYQPQTLAPQQATDGADAELTEAGAHGRPAARCSLWWRRVPAHPGHRLGLIGHWFADDDEAAARLLRRATAVLQKQGCTLAVGPMDGATWRPYRFVIEPGTAPPFFLEPEHPPSYPAQFSAAGFAPMAFYRSVLNPDVRRAMPEAPSAEAFARDGLTLRPLRSDRLQEELHALYRLTARCFKHNFLYTPMPEAVFGTQLHSLLPHLHPKLVLIAEAQQTPIGFLLMVLDVCQAQRGEGVDTVILKTLAVDPDWAGRGVGSLLAAEGQRRAAALGFQRAIHALMHEENRSGRISAHYGETIRRYALFAKPLG